MKPKALFVLSPSGLTKAYTVEVQNKIRLITDMQLEPKTPKEIKDNPEMLRGIEILLTGWGPPRLDETFMTYADKLKVVFHGAGSIRNLVTDYFWDRNIKITSAASANAIPVSEYNYSQSILCLKKVWHSIRCISLDNFGCGDYGAYKSTVGIISLGLIGKRTSMLLRNSGIRILAYDPYIKSWPELEMTCLDSIFKESDTIICCTPYLPETKGMIMGKHFTMMKNGACFINSARGAIVREDEMINTLQRRKDVVAILDVTDPEPPKMSSPLRSMRNIVLTPHIAGSKGKECYRLGDCILEELNRWLNGEELKYQVRREKYTIMA